MIKAGDLVRFRGSDKAHCAHTSIAGKVYLVVEVEPPRQRDGLTRFVRLTGPTIKGAPIETLLYPMYRFEVV